MLILWIEYNNYEDDAFFRLDDVKKKIFLTSQPILRLMQPTGNEEGNIGVEIPILQEIIDANVHDEILIQVDILMPWPIHHWMKQSVNNPFALSSYMNVSNQCLLVSSELIKVGQVYNN